MWGRGVGVVAFVWLAGAGSAAAQNAPVFPASLDRGPLLAWMQRETDILADRVVAVTPQALTSVVSTFPAAPGTSPRVVIRAEAMSAEAYAHTGALSWHVSLNADCESRKVRLGETTGYAERNLLGERRTLRVSETSWRTPEPGTALEAAWRAACEKDFKGPFHAAAVRVAQADPPVAAAAPAPTAAAKTPAPPAKASSPRSRAGTVVQVGATTSEAEARGLLSAMQARLGGREAWVETASVDGKLWRRAVVGGFADSAEAARFCASLKAEGRGCFVRPSRPG
jgi:hypothetical protein